MARRSRNPRGNRRLPKNPNDLIPSSRRGKKARRQGKPSVDEVMKKYGSKIESQIGTSSGGGRSVSGGSGTEGGDYSKSYKTFKQEMAPNLSRYEKWCKSLGNAIKLKVSEKDKKEMQKHLTTAHLDVEPWQALGLAVMSFVTVFFIGLIISVAISLIQGGFGNFPVLFFFLVIIGSVFLFYYMKGYPARLANQWRLKASSQMVPAILYVVVYMRHTPNLEKAIGFAADHLQYPLSLDLKKVFYDVQVGKFSTIKDSLDNYLEFWRDHSTEFIEAFHLIESSLFEPNDAQRVSTLEKSLKVVLDGVYEKMMKFTHEVKAPLTNVYMLAVMLPVLGIALIPLASAMVGGLIKAIHVFVLYNLLIPFLAFFMLDKIMLNRPGGHGESKLLEKNPNYFKYKSSKPYVKAFWACFPLLLIALIPLIFQFTPLPDAMGLEKDYSLNQLGLGGSEAMIFDFKKTEEGIKGPFGIGAVLLSIFFPLSVALFFSMSYKIRTKELIKERQATKQLEKEFNNSLFQLGNRLGNGIPVELAFGKVAQSTQGLKTSDFFNKVNYNIRQLGMSVEKAVFHPKRGALVSYPSDLIATSMRILIEASKKGLKNAARGLMSISEYAKRIDKITRKLKDLLASTISDMKSNMTFLAPLLSGIVVGLAAMITAILNKLQLSQLQEGGAGGVLGSGALQNLLGPNGLFQLEQTIPPYYLQLAIGIYLIQIIFILTSTLVTIDSGQDKLQKTYKTGLNLQKGIGLYVATALIATLILFVLANVVLSGLGG